MAARVRSGTKVDLIARVPLFAGLSKGELGQVASIADEIDLPANKVLIRGSVQAWRPALPRMRVRAGATVQIDADEQIKLTFLHDVLSGKRTDVPRRRHHRLPVSFACRVLGEMTRAAG